MGEGSPPGLTRAPVEAREIRYEAKEPGGQWLVPASRVGARLTIVAIAIMTFGWLVAFMPALGPAMVIQIYIVAPGALVFFSLLVITLFYFRPRRGPAVTGVGIQFPTSLGRKLVEWPFAELREVVVVREGAFTLVVMRGRKGAGHRLPIVVRFFDPDYQAGGIVTTMAEESGVRVLKR